MLGPFMEGLSKGANSAMDLYTKYQDISTTKDLRESMKATKNAPDLGTATPPQAGADVSREAGTNTAGAAQSDSAASAPAQPDKPIDISDMPDPRLRAAGAALRFTPEVLSGNHGTATVAPIPQAPPAAALPPPGSAATPLVQGFQPSGPPQTMSPQQTQTYSSVRPTGGGPPQFGVQTRPTPQNAPPQYLPAPVPSTYNRTGADSRQAAPVGRPVVGGQPVAKAPTLAGESPSLGQRILGSFGDMANQGVPY